MESPFNGMVNVEESELVSQLLGPYPCSSNNELDHNLSSHFWFDHVNNNNANDSFSTSICSNILFALPADYQEYYMCDSNAVPRINIAPDEMNISMIEGEMTQPINSFSFQPNFNDKTSENARDSAFNSSDGKSQHKRKCSVDGVDKPNKLDIHIHNPKSVRVTMQSYKNAKPKKISKKNASSEEGDNHTATSNTVQSLGSCTSEEDDSNTSPASLNLNARARASLGFATDPQTLYARRRRERINGRLRTLQNLVPNGTKVDISTMLEETVQYVKFLQLQIKLLSSDELWMYAPLAYIGMDVGLNMKISPPRQ